MEQFYKLKSQSTIYDDIVDYIKTVDSAKWFNAYSFDILNIPDKLALKDPVISALHKKFPVEPLKTRPVCLRMGPNILYKLHEDTIRLAAINMLISGWDSHSFYGTQMEGSEDMFHINRVIYEPKCYYLFNTKQLHSVLNFDEPRIVFSLGFNPPYSYEAVLNFLKEENL